MKLYADRPTRLLPQLAGDVLPQGQHARVGGHGGAGEVTPLVDHVLGKVEDREVVEAEGEGHFIAPG